MDIKHEQTAENEHSFMIEIEDIDKLIVARYKIYNEKIYSTRIENLELLDAISYFHVTEMCEKLLQSMKIIL